MKKINILSIIVTTALLITSACTRQEPVDPGDLFGPSSFHYIVEGSASPSILWVDGNLRPATKITVRVTDYQQTPLAGQNIYFQQMGTSNGQFALADYGYFENNKRAMYKRTDGNGIVQVTFFGPLLVGSQTEMFIHAIMQDIDQTYKKGAPQDFIKIQFIDATRQ